MKHKTGIIFLTIGGILMILSSAVGSIGIYEFLYDMISTEVDPDLRPLLEIILTIIRFIADWGGGAIIVGAFLIMLNHIRIGKWIVGIGLTFGSLALIIWLISKIVDATDVISDPQILSHLARLKGFFTYGASLQFIGVASAVVGRMFIKKPKKEKEAKEESKTIEVSGEEGESTQPITSENKFCPNCGVELPINALFCDSCGSNFENR